MMACCCADVEDFFADEKYKADRVAMLNTLAAIHTRTLLMKSLISLFSSPPSYSAVQRKHSH
jgi:hypothetical protein